MSRKAIPADAREAYRAAHSVSQEERFRRSASMAVERATQEPSRMGTRPSRAAPTQYELQETDKSSRSLKGKRTLSLVSGMSGSCRSTRTSQAGAVGGRKARVVPIHERVIEQGFTNFVEAQCNGPHFYDADGRRRGDAPDPLKPVRAPWLKSSEKLCRMGAVARWSPRHATRHHEEHHVPPRGRFWRRGPARQRRRTPRHQPEPVRPISLEKVRYLAKSPRRWEE